MTAAIFFDLETSDKNFIGQILNYAFVFVDERLEIKEELCGTVAISCLQLPSPSAILANRINVLEHQELSRENERDAMQRIAAFIEQSVAKTKKKQVVLIGYNSSKFDVPYLRTSFIRNGLNPYFAKKLIYRDLFFSVKKLALSDPKFPRKESPNSKQRQEGKLSLSLETVTQHLGLLKGAQTHNSRDDVLLSIDLARCMRERFNFDPLEHHGYEAAPFHNTMRRGDVFFALHPNYELAKEEQCLAIPMTLLDADYRQSLWINLERFKDKQERRSIEWYNQNSSFLCMKKDDPNTREWREVAKSALQELRDVNLKNYFTTSTCDIEQDIYRLDFAATDALHAAIWKGEGSALQGLGNRDAEVIYSRYKLTNAKPETRRSEKARELLKNYALYRYGGRAKILKFSSTKDAEADGLHQTFAGLLGELHKLREGAPEPDIELLVALEKFYLNSEIYQVAGQELALSQPKSQPSF